MQYADKV